MGQCSGLCFLQMGEAGHEGVRIFLHQIQNHSQKTQGLCTHFLDRTPGIQTHIKSNLVIAAASGVQTLARVADPVDEIGLHEAVYIFILASDLHLTVLDIIKDPLQTLYDGLTVFGGQDALFPKHPGMYHAALYILSVQALVKSDRIVKGLHSLICLLCKPAAP